MASIKNMRKRVSDLVIEVSVHYPNKLTENKQEYSKRSSLAFSIIEKWSIL
jgi:hypothetical protein